MPARCKHCRHRITTRLHVWVHVDGPTVTMSICNIPAVDGQWYYAAPYGQPCRIDCVGYKPGLRAVPDAEEA